MNLCRTSLFKITLFTVTISCSLFSLPSYASRWGLQCKINPLPQTKFCIFCNSEGGEWAKWNIDPDFDDILKKQGWKPKQVALAVRLFLRYHIQKSGDGNHIPTNTEYQNEVLEVIYDLLTYNSPVSDLMHFNEIQSNTFYIQKHYPELRLGTPVTYEDFYKVCENNFHKCFSDQVKNLNSDSCVFD